MSPIDFGGGFSGLLDIDGIPGIETVDWQTIYGIDPLATGVVYLRYFTAPKAVTITQFGILTVTAAVGLTVARAGLYTLDASENGTLVARTANANATMFATSFTPTDTVMATAGGFPASYNIVRGARYAAAVIAVGAGTQPVVAGMNGPGPKLPSSNRARLISAQADLPVSYLVGATGLNADVVWQALRP